MVEKVDKKDHIMDSAELLFSQMGYDGASTRSIAAAANVNMAMLNYYFGSKDGLFKAVIERRLDGFRQTLSNLNDQNISSWDKLNTCIDMYADRILGDNCFHKIIHHELSLQQRSDTTDFITESILRNANEVKRIIGEGIENGSFRDVDTDLTVATIFGTKYYLVNASQIASKLLDKDLQDPVVIREEIKPRVKQHLRDLLKAHLTKHDTNA